jgi:outer membrane receptor for ferrienterochelin and colicins
LKNYQFFYKFEYFNEEINKYASEVLPNYSPETETNNPTANDQFFTSTRFFHHLNASGKIEKAFNYDVSLSYQQQKSDVESYDYFIRLDEKTNVKEAEYQSRQGVYSKGNFTNFLKNEMVDFQLGYEISSIDGYSSTASAALGGFNGGDIKNKLGSYDVFGASEINFNKRFSLRPGARVLFSSQFDTQTSLSLSSKFLLNNGFELRGILGTAPRLPNFDELYTYFVDVNHDMRGNPDLKPEQGVSLFLHLNKTSNLKNGVQLQNKLSAWFLNVKDRIESIIVNESPLRYQYNNIDLYKTWGTSLTNTFLYKDLSFNTGITFSGVSKVQDSQQDENDDYLYGFQVNANASYNFSKYKTIFSAFIKYNGPQYQFVQKQNEEGEDILVKGKQNDFTWLDATIKKSLLKNRFEITAGARNILNITTVNTTAAEGGAHTDAASSMQLGYGRSYFLKLLYKLNF